MSKKELQAKPEPEAYAPPPLRPDLVHVEPFYYPIVEQHRFGSLDAMCRRMGWPRELVDSYVQRAQLECSETVVIDRLVLGEPDNKVCALLIMRPGGSVILCAALFGATSQDRDEVDAICKEFGESPEFAKKLVFIGEFRPNPMTGGVQ